MGNVYCWITVDQELINQHSLRQRGQFEPFSLKERAEQRFWQNVSRFCTLLILSQTYYFTPVDPTKIGQLFARVKDLCPSSCFVVWHDTSKLR